MLETLAAYSIIEWVGLLTGIVYVILSAQNKIVCWYFGIVSCACIAYHDFFGGLNLYSDGILQIFYVVMGVIGLLRWQTKSMTLSRDLKTHLIYISISIIISFVYGFVMEKTTDASFPIFDAFTTIFSVLATILLVNRQLSAWIYFVIIDFTMTLLYFVRGWDLYALLYLIFTIVAVYASYNWWMLYKRETNPV